MDKSGKSNIQVILYEIDCAIFYTNLHELFCQFISWTNWVNSVNLWTIAEYHVKLLCIRLSIVPGLFQFLVLGTFWISLVPGQRDHRTFKVSRSCPARTTGPMTFCPGGPGGPSNFLFFSTSYCIFFNLFCCCITRAKKRKREYGLVFAASADK
jgi:hypothetical protein